MDEYLQRQKAVLRRLIDDYRTGLLHLNTLVQRIEGVSDAIGHQSWKDAIFPIVLALEQVNATTLNAKTSLSESDKAIVEHSLLDLEALIQRFES